jgi:hypothetical protein
MLVLRWFWRVILLLTVGCFITTIYYMTHNVDMDVALPALNVAGVAGTALLGVLWAASRRYWYALIMLASMGLLRGLFNDELLTEFQSVWILISAGFVVFVLLVVLMTRVLKADHDKRAAAAAYAAAHPTVQRGPVTTAAPPVAAPVGAVPVAVATEPAPAVTKLVPWPAPSDVEVAPAFGAAAEAPTKVKAVKKAVPKAAAGGEASASTEAPAAETPAKN